MICLSPTSLVPKIIYLAVKPKYLCVQISINLISEILHEGIGVPAL
jgi:hypothetical protein